MYSLYSATTIGCEIFLRPRKCILGLELYHDCKNIMFQYFIFKEQFFIVVTNYRGQSDLKIYELQIGSKNIIMEKY